MITLPATNEAVLAEAINAALDLLAAKMRTDEARCLLLAIGRQESGFRTREQDGGPARGLWQFERNGVLGVMHASSSAEYLHRLIQDLDVRYGSTPILDALVTDDILAAGVARLLLWCDPRPLPAIGDKIGAWDLYERCWRPGKPSYSRWQDSYAQAMETMRAIA